MKALILRGTSVLSAVVVLAVAAGFVAEAGAPLPRAPEEGRGAVEGAPVEPGVFEGDVRDLPRLPPWKQGDPIREVPRRVHPRPQPPVSPEPSPPDPLFTPQSRGGDRRSFRVFNPPDLVFGGVGFTGAFPPDPVGDVGPDHYVQMVNSGGGSRVRIFDKSGGRLADFHLDSLARGFRCLRGRFRRPHRAVRWARRSLAPERIRVHRESSVRLYLEDP